MEGIIISVLYFVLPAILFGYICTKLYFDKAKTTTKNRKKKIILTNMALIVYALGMLTPLNRVYCLSLAYILMLIVCVSEMKIIGKIKQFLAFLN